MSRYIEIAHRSSDLSFEGSRQHFLVQRVVGAESAVASGLPGPAVTSIALDACETLTPRLAVLRSRGARTAVGAGSTGPDRTGVVLAYNSRESRLANIRDAVSRHEKGLAAARTSSPAGAGKAQAAQLGKRLHQARQELADLNAGEPVS